MKKSEINLKNEFYSIVGTPINPNKLFYVKKHKQSHGIKSLETGKVVAILTNRNIVWLNKEIFPLVKSKRYKKELKDAIETRFPEFKKLFHGKKLVFSLASTSDQRFEWSQK